jgi:hypothetical protein
VRYNSIISKIAASTSNGSQRSSPKGLNLTRIAGGTTTPPLVDTVTVNGAGVPFVSGTLAGA